MMLSIFLEAAESTVFHRPKGRKIRRVLPTFLGLLDRGLGVANLGGQRLANAVLRPAGRYRLRCGRLDLQSRARVRPTRM